MSSTAEARWERWLEERFAGYLLLDAEGAPRDPAHVARALERLHGTPGAWSYLAELGFLLAPTGGLAPLVLEKIPAWLRRVLPVTIRRVEETRGRPRGRTNWSRTLQLRLQAHDRTLFVGVSPERTFETPGAVVVRWLLEQTLRVIERLQPGDLAAARGWAHTLASLHRAARTALSHLALRSLEARRPEAWERQHCAQSHDPVLREAAAVLAFYDELLPHPRQEALQRTVERFALAPISPPRRFELFTLLNVLEALERLLPGWERSDELVLPGRDAVAVWRQGGSSVRVLYDQGVPAGIHAEVMQRALGIQASFRPDIRLIFEGPDGGRELYIDPKHSKDDDYLKDSHIKLLAYVADRPEAFGDVGPKAILATPRPVIGPWHAGDPVAFIDPEGCQDGRLDELLSTWFHQHSIRRTVGGQETRSSYG